MRKAPGFLFLVFIMSFLGLLFFSKIAWASVDEDPRKGVALHYYRGVVNYEAGRYDAALAEFQAVANIDPFYKEVQLYAQKCMELLEKNLEGFDHTRETIGGNKKDVELYFVGKAYYEKGEYRRALGAFKAVLAKKPDDKFALYYSKLCEDLLTGTQGARKSRMTEAESRAASASDLEKEVAYVKEDIKEQEDVELFLEKKAERKAAREELIRKKERQLQEQELLLEDERQEYLAEEKLTKKAEKIKKETEKWRTMKERLASNQPGVPTDLTNYPVVCNQAGSYYVAMKEALRSSRWNSAGLNAINAGIYYCDAVLIYFYGIRSAEPRHENVARLLLDNVKRADTEQALYHVHSILNLKKIIDDEDRPFTRNEAIFLADHAEKIVEWCKTVLP